MGHHGRTIRRLRIKSSDRGAAARCLPTLADAFNTASIPAMPPNGVLIIRHFDLGQFSESYSSTTLSLLIEKKIHKLADKAVRVDHREHPDASVVWFSDAVQPFIALAGLLADGQTASAWYWRCAVPEWKPAMTRPQALLTLTTAAMRTSAGVFAAARVLDRLLESNRLDILLNHLTPQFAVDLLNAAGIHPYHLSESRAAPTASFSPAQYVNAAWQRAISSWLNIWGAQDVRTLLLVYIATLNHNPAIAESPVLLNTVRQVAEMLRKQGHHPTADNDPANRAAGLSMPLTAGYPVEGNAELSMSPAADPTAEKNARLSEPLEDKTQAKKDPDRIDDQEQVGKDSRFEAHIPQRDIQQSLSNNETKQIKPGVVEWEQTFPMGVRSSFAGLVFIIPLLGLVGLRDILNQNADLVDSNFPARILRTVADRLKIPLDDPVQHFIPELAEPAENRVLRFVAPAFWENLVFDQQVKNKILFSHQISDDPDTRLLTDKSQKLILSVGTTAQIKLLPAWLMKCTIKTLTGSQPHPDINSLVNTVLILVERYLRRFAGVGLNTMVKREGAVAITRTHIDVIFDLRYADARIRRAGLDIDPGWVPWFGRIIHFHYVKDEG